LADQIGVPALQLPFAPVVSIDEEVDPGKTAEERLKRFDFRRKVALEILATEQSYVTALTTLQSVYIKALAHPDPHSGNHALLTEQQSSTLFSNIPTIAPLQLEFLSAMHKIIAAWTPEKQEMGNLFLRYAPFFKFYTQVRQRDSNSIARGRKRRKEQLVIRLSGQERTSQVQ